MSLLQGAAGKIALRENTVLANSNIKLERFLMLMWSFIERGKTYAQIINGLSLPSDPGYKENMLSKMSITKYNCFFRFICVNDYNNNMNKLLGGPGVICEID